MTYQHEHREAAALAAAHGLGVAIEGRPDRRRWRVSDVGTGALVGLVERIADVVVVRGERLPAADWAAALDRLAAARPAAVRRHLARQAAADAHRKRRAAARAKGPSLKLKRAPAAKPAAAPARQLTAADVVPAGRRPRGKVFALCRSESCGRVFEAPRSAWLRTAGERCGSCGAISDPVVEKSSRPAAAPRTAASGDGRPARPGPAPTV